ncbi:MAG: hypothetical protein KA932_08505 [Giesbergeria sp.]|nr:hypothetical protein [Giesbergeria sp.]
MPDWISGLKANDWIAGYAALLSTVIAIGQSWGWLRNRPRLDVTYNFSSNKEDGNTVTIRNLSDKQIILAYWELLYCTGHWPLRSFEIICSSVHDLQDTPIAAYSSCSLNFARGDYFAWSHKALKGRRIFIRLVIAGQRERLRLVYDGT